MLAGYVRYTCRMMPSSLRFRFGVFEADAETGELRRQGTRIKLHVQPFQVLLLLLTRPGELLTREEIARELWPEGTFVDHEHGVNSAINRIRDALGDSAKNPRFLETLARRGYRFVAPVQKYAGPETPAAPISDSRLEIVPEAAPRSLLAAPHDLPAASHRTVQTLFLLLQLMYLAFYVGALANLAELEDLFSGLRHPAAALVTLIATAVLLIPVRLFLLTAVLFQPPRLRARYLQLWPVLLCSDLLWSLAPFLLLHHLSGGLALACVAPLVYAPFAQRSLVLMGAAQTPAAGA